MPSPRAAVRRVKNGLRRYAPFRVVRAFSARTGAAYRRQRVRNRAIRRLVAKEREWRVPFTRRSLRAWRQGFLSRSAVIYDLKHNDPDDYVTDVQRYLSTRRMVHPRLQDVINNKLTTHLLLQTMDVRCAELLGVYWRGAVHRFPKEDRDPLKDFLLGLADEERVFFKALAGAEGKNIFSIRRQGTHFRMNGRTVSLATARSAIEEPKRPMIVERGVEQHPDQRALFAETTNTLRLLTMLDMEDRQPFIVVGVQRIGTLGSGGVDNWTQGGLSARVDLETGRLGRATRLPSDDQLEWFSQHPETGAPIEGAVVPHWQEIRETVLHASRVLSFMEYVGWDIIVAPEGPVVLEANINSGMNVLQVHQPLLTDPRVRAYFAKRGVVPPRQSEGSAPPESDVLDEELQYSDGSDDPYADGV